MNLNISPYCPPLCSLRQPVYGIMGLFIVLCLTLGASLSASNQSSEPMRITAFGDSLTAGYGLPADQAWPTILEKNLQQAGHSVIVQNAGVSGDSSAAGLRRIRWSLRNPSDIFIIALGGNDALRATDPASTESNLRAIIETVQQHNPECHILLAGMYAPPNLGDTYAESFAAIYQTLAEELDITLLPFMLEGVAGDPDLNLADGIHPNATGHKHIANLIKPLILKWLPDNDQ